MRRGALPIWVRFSWANRSIPARSPWSIFKRSGVIHFHQIQSLRRRHRPAGGAVACFQRLFDLTLLPLVFAHQFQGAGEGANLMVQKRARAGLDMNLFPALADIQAVERLDWRLG